MHGIYQKISIENIFLKKIKRAFICLLIFLSTIKNKFLIKSKIDKNKIKKER